ncbi:MAG: diguanylate cyclase [Shimia sp.]|nr:diguanylate cyclase [Shimia sp.]
MTGHILIVDSIAANRCILKAKLSGSFLQVRQAEAAEEAFSMMRSTRPDLVLLCGNLTDLTRDQFCRRFSTTPDLATVPLVVFGTRLERSEKLDALRTGADDALSTPLADAPFLARIRCLLRAHATAEDLRLQETADRIPGLAEDSAGFAMPSTAVLTAPAGKVAHTWRTRLKPLVPYRMRAQPLADAMRSMSLFAAPDAFVIAVNANASEESLRFLAEIRARAATRQAAVLIVLDRDDDVARVNALDFGANDVMTGGFDPEEAALRLSAILKRKRLTDRLSRSVKAGLNAAVTDPLTGLYNRRYALPQLASMARHARTAGQEFAVMVADLDHFKRVNDKYGHTAGDVVLAEVARRLRQALKGNELIARIGGEEFLIVMPVADARAASLLAHNLCAIVRRDPVYLRARDIRIPVTISIGVTLGHELALLGHQKGQDADAIDFIDHADKALYDAKACGRDSVTMARPAA